MSVVRFLLSLVLVHLLLTSSAQARLQRADELDIDWQPLCDAAEVLSPDTERVLDLPAATQPIDPSHLVVLRIEGERARRIRFEARYTDPIAGHDDASISVTRLTDCAGPATSEFDTTLELRPRPTWVVVRRYYRDNRHEEPARVAVRFDEKALDTEVCESAPRLATGRTSLDGLIEGTPDLRARPPGPGESVDTTGPDVVHELVLERPSRVRLRVTGTNGRPASVYVVENCRDHEAIAMDAVAAGPHPQRLQLTVGLEAGRYLVVVDSARETRFTRAPTLETEIVPHQVAPWTIRELRRSAADLPESFSADLFDARHTSDICWNQHAHHIPSDAAAIAFRLPGDRSVRVEVDRSWWAFSGFLALVSVEDGALVPQGCQLFVPGRSRGGQSEADHVADLPPGEHYLLVQASSERAAGEMTARVRLRPIGDLEQACAAAPTLEPDEPVVMVEPKSRVLLPMADETNPRWAALYAVELTKPSIVSLRTGAQLVLFSDCTPGAEPQWPSEMVDGDRVVRPGRHYVAVYPRSERQDITFSRRDPEWRDHVAELTPGEKVAYRYEGPERGLTSACTTSSVSHRTYHRFTLEAPGAVRITDDRDHWGSMQVARAETERRSSDGCADGLKTEFSRVVMSRYLQAGPHMVVSERRATVDGAPTGRSGTLLLEVADPDPAASCTVTLPEPRPGALTVDLLREADDLAPSTCFGGDLPELTRTFTVDRRTRVVVEIGESSTVGALSIRRSCAEVDTEVACSRFEGHLYDTVYAGNHPCYLGGCRETTRNPPLEAMLEPGTYSLVVEGWHGARMALELRFEDP